MEKLKSLQSIVKSDKLIMSEMRRLIGIGCTYEQLKTYQDRLKYGEAESLLDNLKADFDTSIADKIVKIGKEIDKIRTDDYNVCLYINSVFKNRRIKVEENKQSIITQTKTNVWTAPDLSSINSDFKVGLSSIKAEKIPVVLSNSKVVDLTKMPHLLVAGQTGSGKSVFMNVFISTVVLKTNPQNCKLVLIDPKRVEFSLYRGIPHLWRPVATQIDKIEKVLNELIQEMESRFIALEKYGVRNLDSYNEKTKDKKPYIVVVIDELADLMMVSCHSVEEQITRLAQLARAVGIHIVMATQRPVVEIMTGLIKSNMPSRISFKVASKQDSRVILDQNGAESLKCAGEMIFMQNGQTEKFQGIYISEEEVKKITNN